VSIPFIDLKSQYRALKQSIDDAIQQVLDHGQFILGPEVAALEHELAALVGTSHCVTCASGTDALLMSLMALGIGPGDEVITPSFSFIATAEVIVLVGATPVFVDVEATTGNLDTAKLRSAITSRVKAIMPVSLYGQPADMDEINAIAAARGIVVIEDGAQSFGAWYGKRRSGGLSTIGCTSFFPSKPLGCYGDGGAVFTDDDGLAAAMREIRVHGQAGRYHHTRIGIGGRMDTLQCAILLAKLSSFEKELTARAQAGERYTRLFEQHAKQVGLIRTKPGRTSAHAQYTIIVERREALRKALDADGIPTAVHYPKPIHRQPAYARWGTHVYCPVSDWLSDRVLSLPMHAYLGAHTQSRIVEAVARYTRTSPSNRSSAAV
jgi:UDP-2-acetamido-2-deoxy-ribo-hexuluronate aminotransferase